MMCNLAGVPLTILRRKSRAGNWYTGPNQEAAIFRRSFYAKKRIPYGR